MRPKFIVYCLSAICLVFGLKGFERSYPSELSGGMRQRAALLRTVMQNRDVLLLDEPLGALDSLTRTQMQKWLEKVIYIILTTATSLSML